MTTDNETKPDGRTVRAVANRLAELIIQGNRANYEIGAVIDQVYRERLWEGWMGVVYATFDAWAWAVLGRKERWARYMRSNFLQISAMNLGDDTLARVMRLGWTKLAQVLRVANNEHHLLQWIDRIDDEKMTEEDIRAEVAIAVGGPGDVDGESAKDTGSSVAPSPRGGGDTSRPRRISYELVFVNDDDLRVFVKAVKLVRQRINPEMSQGEAAALIATNYLGVSARDDEGGLAVELETLIQCIEQGYNVRLKVSQKQPKPRKRSAAPVVVSTDDDEPF